MAHRAGVTKRGRRLRPKLETGLHTDNLTVLCDSNSAYIETARLFVTCRYFQPSRIEMANLTMNTYGESKFDSIILNFCTTYRWAISFMPRPLYSRGKSAPVPNRIGGWVDARAVLESNPSFSAVQPVACCYTDRSGRVEATLKIRYRSQELIASILRVIACLTSTPKMQIVFSSETSANFYRAVRLNVQ
jgi:hypothetical protein